MIKKCRKGQQQMDEKSQRKKKWTSKTSVLLWFFFFFFFKNMSVCLISTTNTLKRKYDFTTMGAMKLNGTKSLGASQAQEKRKGNFKFLEKDVSIYPCQFQLVQSLWRRFLKLLFAYDVQQAK